MSYSTWLKEKLLSIIKEMDRAPWLFARDPPKDFSRVKKWSLSETANSGKTVRLFRTNGALISLETVQV